MILRGFGAKSTIITKGFGSYTVVKIIQKAINAIYFLKCSVITTFIEKTQHRVHKR